jgi:Tfp pilus assembly protein FimT
MADEKKPEHESFLRHRITLMEVLVTIAVVSIAAAMLADWFPLWFAQILSD